MEKLSPEEKRMVEEMALVCHEEMVRGVPLKAVTVQCNKCRKRVNFTATCPKYPKWIPDEVLTGGGCPDFEPKEVLEDGT